MLTSDGYIIIMWTELTFLRKKKDNIHMIESARVSLVWLFSVIKMSVKFRFISDVKPTVYGLVLLTPVDNKGIILLVNWRNSTCQCLKVHNVATFT